MHAAGEVVPLRLLLATVVQTNLGIRHTTVVARLRVGLVLLVSVATSGSASHFYKIITNTNALLNKYQYFTTSITTNRPPTRLQQINHSSKIQLY
jgi:hypothetical protein